MGKLRDFRSYGEPGAMVYLGDCVELMRLMPPSCVNMIFADPPYRLSVGGVTVKSGRIASVNKGEWYRSLGVGSCVLLDGPGTTTQHPRLSPRLLRNIGASPR